MNNQNPTVGLIYFSSTGTTRKVCEEIAKAISLASPIRIDLTRPPNPEEETLNLRNVDVCIVGIPVYASRMPSLAKQRITKALANIPKNTPAVAVTVYGKVDAGIALQELIDLLTEYGLRVIGAGEFIGEHYFKKFHGINAKETVGRPDAADLAIARELGISVLKKGFDSPPIESKLSTERVKVPFKLKFVNETRVLGLLGISTVDSSKCIKCQACVRACPTGCINPQTLTSNGEDKSCIGCGNCMRVCPKNARTQSIKLKWLVKLAAKPKSTNKSLIYCT